MVAPGVNRDGPTELLGGGDQLEHRVALEPLLPTRYHTTPPVRYVQPVNDGKYNHPTGRMHVGGLADDVAGTRVSRLIGYVARLTCVSVGAMSSVLTTVVFHIQW